jgi:hypothetical protein
MPLFINKLNVTVLPSDNARNKNMCSCKECLALPPHPHVPGKHIDPRTGIFPIHEWGGECGRGFGDHVFPRPRVRAQSRTNNQRRKHHDEQRTNQ